MNADQIQRVSNQNLDLIHQESTGGAIVFDENLKTNLEIREKIKLCLKRVSARKMLHDPLMETDMGVITVSGQKYLWRIRYFNNHIDGYSTRPWDPMEVRRILYVISL